MSSSQFLYCSDKAPFFSRPRLLATAHSARNGHSKHAVKGNIKTIPLFGINRCKAVTKKMGHCDYSVLNAIVHILVRSCRMASIAPRLITCTLHRRRLARSSRRASYQLWCTRSKADKSMVGGDTTKQRSAFDGRRP